MSRFEELYPNMRNVDIARELGLSPVEVGRMARKMGLSKSGEYRRKSGQGDRCGALSDKPMKPEPEAMPKRFPLVERTETRNLLRHVNSVFALPRVVVGRSA